MAQPTPSSLLNNPSHSTLHNHHFNVKAYSATGDDSTDDTAAITAAITAAGAGGRVYFPPGTYRVGSLAPLSYQVWEGAGQGSAILKAKAAATEAVLMAGLLHVEMRNLAFDGNAVASKGVVVKGGTSVGSQSHLFSKCAFQNSSTGVSVETGTTTQADKNTFVGCKFDANTTGLRVNTINGQQQLLLGCTFDNHTTAIQVTNGDLTWITGQVQTATTALLVDGATVDHINLTDLNVESVTTALRLDNAPFTGVWLTNCALSGVTNAINAGANSIRVIARGCLFGGGTLLFSGNGAEYLDDLNTYIGSTVSMTGATPHRQGYDPLNGLELNHPAGYNALAWGAAGAGTGAVDTNLYRFAADILKTDDSLIITGNATVSGSFIDMGGVGGFIQFKENGTTDAGAGATNSARLYCKDNGAGKTQLCVRFNTGAVQVIATEP